MVKYCERLFVSQIGDVEKSGGCGDMSEECELQIISSASLGNKDVIYKNFICSYYVMIVCVKSRTG